MSKSLLSTKELNLSAKPIEPSVRINDKLYWVNGTIKPLDKKKLKKVKSKDKNFGFCQTTDFKPSPYFLDFFYKKEHYNYIGFDPIIGNIIMSISKELSSQKEDEEIAGKVDKKDFYYLLVRTNKLHYCAMGNVYNGYENQGPNEILKALLPKLKINADFKLIGNFEITEKLNQYDDLCIPLDINVGVLLQLKGQENESEIFGNNAVTSKLREFLNCISNEIKLKGFKGYKGGLDVKTNTNGETGYYVKIGRREIMFHVGPLLPWDQKDTEHISRKKYIGNNLITIIFQEKNTKFNPKWISSKFLHVFIIIQPEKVDDILYYKVCIAAKKDVPEIKQILPEVSYFIHGSNFKFFMFDLLFKSQEAALMTKNVLEIFNKTKANLLQTIAMIYVSDGTYYSSLRDVHHNEKDNVKNSVSAPNQTKKIISFKDKVCSTIRTIKKRFNGKRKILELAVRVSKIDSTIVKKPPITDTIKRNLTFQTL